MRKRPRNYKLGRPVKVLVGSTENRVNSIIKQIYKIDRSGEL